jgi:hypothetical protein
MSFETPLDHGTDLDSSSIPPLDRDDESGYASGGSSVSSLPEVYFTKAHLKFLNRQLQTLEPQGKSKGPFRQLLDNGRI